MIKKTHNRKRKNLKYKFSKYLSHFKTKSKEKQKSIKKDVWIDKGSYSFVKTLILLKKYKSRLRQNTMELMRRFWILIIPFWKSLEEKDHLMIKRRVIKQNIIILKAKKNWGLYSFSLGWKIYKAIIEILSFISWKSLNYLFLVVLIYSFIFIIFYTLGTTWYYLWEVNYIWVYYFIFYLILFILLSFSRWIISLIFNFVIFFFIVIFSIVNF